MEIACERIRQDDRNSLVSLVAMAPIATRTVRRWPIDHPGGVSTETLANLWLRWNVTRALQARTGLPYVGRRYSDDANNFRIHSYTSVDATLSCAVTPRLAVDIHGYNLFDRDYALSTYNNQQWVLGRPRSVDVSLRASF